MKAVVALAIVGAIMVAGGMYKMNANVSGSEIPTPAWDAFSHWKQQYGKSYGTDTENAFRAKIFYNNMLLIRADYAPENTYTLGLNQFADLSQQEFKQLYLGYQKRTSERREVELEVKRGSQSVDWRDKGAVTAVKDQAQCGSCWAFSATGSLEGSNYLVNGQLTSFSEQELVDCSSKQGNQGCNGGLMDSAFDYVEAKGLETESNYPYTAKTGRKCKANGKSAVGIDTYADVKANNATQFKAAVAMQPVSIAVDAGKLQMYTGGIFNKKCGTQLDHGVLCVGYDMSGSTPYYIVKNSWGKSWGESGYFRFGETSSKHGMCGMFMQPSYPTASSN